MCSSCGPAELEERKVEYAEHLPCPPVNPPERPSSCPGVGVRSRQEAGGRCATVRGKQRARWKEVLPTGLAIFGFLPLWGCGGAVLSSL